MAEPADRIAALPLHQRLRIRVGELLRRSDVKVHVLETLWDLPLKRWEGKLPADMMEFYQGLNGLEFYFDFEGEGESWHGFTLLAFDRDGRKVIRPRRRTYSIPWQAAKKYPDYFFANSHISGHMQVLFFMGSDDAWGVVMTGQGEDVRFYAWDNDGFTRLLPGTFTQVIERLLDRGFAHTWARDTHPDTLAVQERMKRPAPLRPTFELKVEALEVRTASAERRRRIATWTAHQLKKAIKLLGLDAAAAGLKTVEERIALVDEATASLDGITDEVAAALLKTLKERDTSRARFAACFRCDGASVASARIHMRYLGGPFHFFPTEDMLLRALLGVPGWEIAAGFPGPVEVLHYVPPRLWGVGWTYFQEFRVESYPTEALQEATATILIDAAQARGMEVGQVRTSTGLPGLDPRIE